MTRSNNVRSLSLLQYGAALTEEPAGSLPGEEGERGGHKFRCKACPDLKARARSALVRHFDSTNHIRNVRQLEATTAARRARQGGQEAEEVAAEDPGGWDGDAGPADEAQEGIEQQQQLMDVELKRV